MKSHNLKTIGLVLLLGIMFILPADARRVRDVSIRVIDNKLYLSDFKDILLLAMNKTISEFRDVEITIKPIIVGSARSLADDENKVSLDKIGDLDLWIDVDLEGEDSSILSERKIQIYRKFLLNLEGLLNTIFEKATLIANEFNSILVWGAYSDNNKTLNVATPLVLDIPETILEATYRLRTLYQNYINSSDEMKGYNATKLIKLYLQAELFIGDYEVYRNIRDDYLIWRGSDIDFIENSIISERIIRLCALMETIKEDELIRHIEDRLNG